MGLAPPQKAQRLFLVRHGESEGNVNKDVHRQTPDHFISVTERGWREQILPCGPFLRAHIAKEGGLENRRFALWHSSFLRACQTAKGIHMAIQDLNPEVHMRDSLGEISYGHADGLGDEVAAQEYPDYGSQRQRDSSHNTMHFLRFPNGESRADVGVRVRLFIESLQRKVKESGITDHIVVTHGVTLRVIVKEWLNLHFSETDQEKNPGNCDVRLIARRTEGVGFEDCGYIYRRGLVVEPQIVPHRRAIDRMASDEYIPRFARPNIG